MIHVYTMAAKATTLAKQANKRDAAAAEGDVAKRPKWNFSAMVVVPEYDDALLCSPWLRLHGLLLARPQEFGIAHEHFAASWRAADLPACVSVVLTKPLHMETMRAFVTPQPVPAEAALQQVPATYLWVEALLLCRVLPEHVYVNYTAARASQLLCTVLQHMPLPQFVSICLRAQRDSLLRRTVTRIDTAASADQCWHVATNRCVQQEQWQHAAQDVDAAAAAAAFSTDQLNPVNALHALQLRTPSDAFMALWLVLQLAHWRGARSDSHVCCTAALLERCAALPHTVKHWIEQTLSAYECYAARGNAAGDALAMHIARVGGALLRAWAPHVSRAALLATVQAHGRVPVPTADKTIAAHQHALYAASIQALLLCKD